MPLTKIASQLVRSGIAPGICGGLLAFSASNAWFYYFAALVIPGLPGRSILPDIHLYLQIDAHVGAGCGYAGLKTGQNIAALRGVQDEQARVIPLLYAFVLGVGISVIVNMLLLFMLFVQPSGLIQMADRNAWPAHPL